MAILVVLLDILREFGLLGFGPLVHQFDDVLFEHHITGHALHHLFQLVELRYHSWQGDVFRFQILHLVDMSPSVYMSCDLFRVDCFRVFTVGNVGMTQACVLLVAMELAIHRRWTIGGRGIGHRCIA